MKLKTTEKINESRTIGSLKKIKKKEQLVL